MLSVEDIEDNFELLQDWDERYRYLIELGRELDSLPAEAHNELNRVRGCASQVWLETKAKASSGATVLSFRGDSDAHIVKGLIYLALAIFGERPAAEILELDGDAVFRRLGLGDHLTPQRSNGFRAMVDRIRTDARASLAPSSGPATASAARH